MPLPPLENPSSRRKLFAGNAKAVPISAFLFGTLLGMNALQLLSLGVKPFSARGFRRINRWAADTWWGLCVSASRKLQGIDIVVTGDEVPARENAIVFANHQQMSDITFLLIYARTKERLGDLKWLVKRPVLFVPGVGWGMAFLDCLFVKRDWAKDRKSVERTFARLNGARVPLWLVSFPEGTRLTPQKLERSREYARRNGESVPEHVMLPRTKGFVASMHGLRDHAQAVYDVTIGYEGGVPNLWQYISGFAPRAHLHVRRFPIAGLPATDEALAEWLKERFREKDRLLARFYETGAFPDGRKVPVETESRPEPAFPIPPPAPGEGARPSAR